jgi:hypothetical protein
MFCLLYNSDYYYYHYKIQFSVVGNRMPVLHTDLHYQVSSEGRLYSHVIPVMT